VLALVNSDAYRELSPKQIVPRLADQGVYVASEATMYRLLREHDQLAHRGRARAPVKRPRPEHVANGPNQVWSWDIIYLRGPVRGRFLYLYLVLDVYSRRIMAAEAHEVECANLASALIHRTCESNGVDARGLWCCTRTTADR
jgi:transposase InsO family protein